MMKMIPAAAAIMIGVTLPSHAEETLVARATNYIGDAVERTFQLDIVEIKHNAASNRFGRKFDISREVRIRCIKGCKKDISYRDQQLDMPFGGAFVLRDDSHEFITAWASGSAYRVRIYRVEGDHIAKVMDEGTKSFPQFVMDRDGAFMVLLDNPDSSAKVRKIVVRGAFWRNGSHGYTPKR